MLSNSCWSRHYLCKTITMCIIYQILAVIYSFVIWQFADTIKTPSKVITILSFLTDTFTYLYYNLNSIQNNVCFPSVRIFKICVPSNYGDEKTARATIGSVLKRWFLLRLLIVEQERLQQLWFYQFTSCSCYYGYK